MARFISFVILFASLCGIVLSKPQTRIVGSEEADIKDAPWQVAVWYGPRPTFYCSGSIIKDNVILTTSFCPYVNAVELYYARAGSTMHDEGGQLRNISRIVWHEDAMEILFDSDLALLFTQSPFQLDGVTVATIQLPSQGQAVLEGSAAIMTGWGSLVPDGPNSKTLRKVIMPTVSQDVCSVNSDIRITSNMLCAGYATGGHGMCGSDTGNPLVVGGTLVGVASWSWGCGLPGFLNVFVRVPEFRNWIDEKISNVTMIKK